MKSFLLIITIFQLTVAQQTVLSWSKVVLPQCTGSLLETSSKLLSQFFNDSKGVGFVLNYSETNQLLSFTIIDGSLRNHTEKIIFQISNNEKLDKGQQLHGNNTINFQRLKNMKFTLFSETCRVQVGRGEISVFLTKGQNVLQIQTDCYLLSFSLDSFWLSSHYLNWYWYHFAEIVVSIIIMVSLICCLFLTNQRQVFSEFLGIMMQVGLFGIYYKARWYSWKQADYIIFSDELITIIKNARTLESVLMVLTPLLVISILQEVLFKKRQVSDFIFILIVIYMLVIQVSIYSLGPYVIYVIARILIMSQAQPRVFSMKKLTCKMLTSTGIITMFYFILIIKEESTHLMRLDKEEQYPFPSYAFWTISIAELVRLVFENIIQTQVGNERKKRARGASQIVVSDQIIEDQKKAKMEQNKRMVCERGKRASDENVASAEILQK